MIAESFYDELDKLAGQLGKAISGWHKKNKLRSLGRRLVPQSVGDMPGADPKKSERRFAAYKLNKLRRYHSPEAAREWRQTRLNEFSRNKNTLV